MSELQGVVLCSGGGTRMTSLTDDVAKCMLPVVGVPMFLYPMSSLIRAGVKDIKIFVRDNVKNSLSAAIGESGYAKGVDVEVVSVSREYEEFGTAELLRHYSSKINKDAIILSCDFVSDSSLTPLTEIFRAYKATLVGLVCDSCVSGQVPASDLMAFDEENGRIAFLSAEEDFEGVVRSERWTDSFPNLLLTAKYNDCHVYAIRHSALQLLHKNKNLSSFKADFVPYLLEKQLEEGSTISCFVYRLPHENGFVTAHANNIASYLEVNKAILKSFPRLFPKMGNGATFSSREKAGSSSDVRVADGVEIGERSQLKRSVINLGCVIGSNVKIKESLIFSNCKVGNGTSITNSIICEDSEVGENAEITNCIVTRSQKVPPKVKFVHEVIQSEDSEEWADQ